MEAAQNSFISSTFWTERIGASAALKTLEIMENTWFDFISNYETSIQSESNFENVSSKSIDTGTGHNDSVLVNGTFDGEASILKFKMINSQGDVIETISKNLENKTSPTGN